LAIDFVLHGDGPATSWAAQARRRFPRRRRSARLVHRADDFDWYLLAGDETACRPSAAA
jgi:NADPH-dependent ferric siderophore reductase